MEWTIAACIAFAMLLLAIASVLVRLGRVLALLDDARDRIAKLEARRDLTTPHAELAAETRQRLNGVENRMTMAEIEHAKLGERTKEMSIAPRAEGKR